MATHSYLNIEEMDIRKKKKKRVSTRERAKTDILSLIWMQLWPKHRKNEHLRKKSWVSTGERAKAGVFLLLWMQVWLHVSRECLFLAAEQMVPLSTAGTGRAQSLQPAGGTDGTASTTNLSWWEGLPGDPILSQSPFSYYRIDFKK